MRQSKRERTKLEKQKKSRIWAAAIIAVCIVLVGSILVLQQNSAKTADTGIDSLESPPAVAQPATQSAVEAIGEQIAIPSADQPSSPDLQVTRVTADETRALLQSGEAFLYDVRSLSAYQDKHAAGAISFPEADIETNLATLPVDKKLIFYCT